MLRFKIDFKLQNSDSTFPLNGEWTVYCKSKTDHGNQDLDVYLNHNGIVPRKEILVSGRLSASGPMSRVEEKVFSNYWSISTRSMHLALLYKCRTPSVYSKKFRILGDITIASKCDKCACISPSGESDKCVQLKSLMQLSNDFERLLSDPPEPCCSDVTLTCGDVSIPAHKLILSARSQYFAAMFSHPMKENLENQVCITDVDANVFQNMMTCIYSGKTSNLTISSASDLLVAADKYQLQDLKDVCCDFLKSKVTLENVVNILVLGDRLDERLKLFGVDYINMNCANFSALENTEEWKTLKIKQPALALDVLASLVKSKQKK